MVYGLKECDRTEMKEGKNESGCERTDKDKKKKQLQVKSQRVELDMGREWN